MRDQIKIVLPPPDARLHAHNKGHWRSKADATKALRELAYMTAKPSAPSEPWERAIVTYHFWFAENRKRDAANAIQSMKAAIDGVVDAGIIADDCWQCLTISRVHCDIDRVNPRTELVFTRQDN